MHLNTHFLFIVKEVKYGTVAVIIKETRQKPLFAKDRMTLGEEAAPAIRKIS